VNRQRVFLIGPTVLTILVIGGVRPDVVGNAVTAQGPRPKAPIFEFDPTWPKPLPETWAIGPVVGASVDSHDHIWIVHRVSALVQNDRYTAAARKPPIAECCVPAPAVLEFDQAGNLISSWGGPGSGYEWPQSEHGIFVDHKDNVWLAGNGRKDAQILKFTRQGKFLQQFGHQGKSTGNADTQNFGQAADIKVDPMSNEAYIADGYGNRRVIVIDGDTGAFKRMWGAYGHRPDDANIGNYDPDAPPAQQFRTPHAVAISKDGLVYVADRSNDRVQVFKKDGSFVKEVSISARTRLSGSASGVAFSTDPQQRFLYVLDGANHRVWILLRDSLQTVGRFGRHGHWAGQLDVPHNMAVDTKGNLYIAETLEGRRVQRFLFKGVGAR
jgi:DNA-binding beta-propeller fold protein YncE